MAKSTPKNSTSAIILDPDLYKELVEITNKHLIVPKIKTTANYFIRLGIKHYKEVEARAGGKFIGK